MPKRRAEVPVSQTWNLDDIFPSREAWEKELQAIVGDVTTVTKYQGHLGEGAKVLLDCLNAYEALLARGYRVVVYASLKLSEDGTNPSSQEAMGKVASAQATLMANLAFIRSEVLALPDGTVERYISEEPGLKSLKRPLDVMLADKPHMLTPESEVILASLGEILDSPYMVYQRGKAADLKFEPVVDGQGKKVDVSLNMYEAAFEKSADTTLRRNSFASFSKGLSEHKETFGAVWGTEAKKNIVLAKLRKFPSATEALLHPQEVPVGVYNNLPDVIQAELAPHMRRYVNLRKKVLGLDKIMYCDIEAPLDPGYSPETTFEEASRLIISGLSVLGDEYAQIMRDAFRQRWIDWADNTGKGSGAFTSSVPGVHPYVLITWGGNLRGAFTLAHELGHAGHAVLTERNQRLLNSEPSMFFVEAPSTINELLLADYILASTADMRMRRWVIMGLLATYYHNFVRHILEAELQRRTYRLGEAGQPITAALLCKVQGEILQDFWAGTVEVDDGARLTWMRQPHFYMGLYPYTYSAGLTCGTAVALDIREQGKPAAERWVEVLKAGGTKKPLELMKMAGVDLSRPDPIRKAVAYVGSLVDEVEKTF